MFTINIGNANIFLMKMSYRKRKSLFYKGMTAVEVIKKIAELNKKISLFRFLAYQPTSSLKERLSIKHNLLIINNLNKSNGLKKKGTFEYLGLNLINFWFKNDDNFLIEQMLKHQENFDDQNVFYISTRASIIDSINSIIYRLGSNNVLGVCSKVKLINGSIFHIPMIDFNIEPSKENLKTVKNALRRIGQEQGVILNSGRSYHFYGLAPINENDWRSFLGQCLLFSPIVDARYIAHRLIDGECVLRLSPSIKKPKGPEVIDVF